jgi:hypothetical protein
MKLTSSLFLCNNEAEKAILLCLYGDYGELGYELEEAAK